MSRPAIFVTGGGGFVGRPLLRALLNEGMSVTALDRSGSIGSDPEFAGITTVRGDLLDPDSYAPALVSCDVVLHLAAATGKARAQTHLRDTAAGTELLLQACEHAGVAKILLVSTIAAGFSTTRGYPYAVAKQRAEKAVATSGLRFAILRPTMIFGEGAPVLASLSALALLPAIVLPGTGRVRVQPIAVEDVVRAILTIVRQDWFRSETFDVGGPEVITMAELLQRLRRAHARERGRVVRLPLGLIQAPLRAAEAVGLHALLPVTAGQLTSFGNDGTVRDNRLQKEIETALVPLDRMLGSVRPSTDAVERGVHDECTVFTRHLLRMDPDNMVIASYHEAVTSLDTLTPVGRWDRTLLRIARTGVVWARCADAYASLFSRSSALRKRLVMLLAILETRPPFSNRIDQAVEGPGLLLAGRLVFRGIVATLGLIAGTLLLAPLQILLSRRRDPAR